MASSSRARAAGERLGMEGIYHTPFDISLFLAYSLVVSLRAGAEDIYILEAGMLAIGLLAETHGGGNVTWLLWVALGFFGLMVVVGWLTSRNQKPEKEPESAQHEEHEKHE